MPKHTKSEGDEKKRSKALPSSAGEDSKSVTPKDVSSGDASARDVTERKMAQDDPEQEEETLDDAVELTFPASDPIAIPTPDEKEQDRRRRASQQ